DLAQLRAVGDPQLSPDGAWVAYTVSAPLEGKDEMGTDIWVSRWQDGTERRVTFDEGAETLPRWSPDGRYLAFLSSRGDERKQQQLWLLDRAGGEAERVTALAGEVTDYAFAPDGRRVVLVVRDPDPAADAKTPPPIVIDRYYFKEDETGYLGARRRHLMLLDLATRSVEPLTSGRFDEILPSWSPDGSRIAFVSKRDGEDPDRHDRFGIYVMAPKMGAAPRLVTSYQGSGDDTDWATAPVWSPDGREIAYVAGGDPKLIFYAIYGIAVVSAEGGTPRYLTRGFDRNAEQPAWSRDGRFIRFLFEDDGNQHVAQVPARGGTMQLLTTGRREVQRLHVVGDRTVVLQSTVDRPPEVYALERGGLRPLSRRNDAWLALIRLATVDEFRAVSRDGTSIGGFVVKPPDFVPGRRYPTILRIHGGPVSQYANAFMFDWQLFAAQGYVVVAGNPRGSSGRGQDFSTAIYADWGNKDAQDVLALVDHVVALGIADPDRLGIGGWSYGGMLTNYVIAQDRRFKAAVSGSSISNILAGYGTDMYVREYEAELGTPWTRFEAWQRVSFPFLHADRIVTPTLFLCGSDDFNVPLLNSEQM
ncbi:MAG: S9 family peptidase, partial [Steroidobacteraceae bacterium]|nr:S9 family peptidase [Steroidobacteraceae bacterium]